MAVCRECKKSDAINGIPYCASCLADIEKKYNDSPVSKLWCLCAELSIPYLSEFVNHADVKGFGDHTEKPIAKYIKTLQKNNIEGDFGDSDKHLYELLKPVEVVESVDVSEYENEIKQLKERVAQLEAENADLKESANIEVLDIDRAIRTWGDDYTEEEYELLDDIFNTYTCEVDKLSPPMRFRYQDLAKLELRRRQLGSNADPKESKTIADELGKLYDMLGINNFEQTQKSDEEKFLDKLCWEIENTQPAEVEDLDKYKDFSNMKEPFEDIMRCLLNATAGQKEFPELRSDMAYEQ